MAKVHLAVRCKCGHLIMSDKPVREPDDPRYPTRVFIKGVTVDGDPGPIPCENCGETYEYMESDVREVVDPRQLAV